MRVRLGWGQRPLEVTVPEGSRVLQPPALPGQDWASVVEAALGDPVGEPLSGRLRGARRVAVLVPDETRKGVARSLLPLIAPSLKGLEVSVGVAAGKHPPKPMVGTDWSHDAAAETLIRVGETRRGTEVRYPRQVLEADLRILLGEIRPHYFAGWAGGAKGLFPGVAGEAGIWHNHRLKAEAGARLGLIDGNPCRADLEEAAALAGPAFLLNVVRAQDGGLLAAVAGDLIGAHRAGVALARPAFEVASPPPAPVVLVSDRSPVTMNLYQACKLLPPAGPLLAPGGTIVLAAALEDGVGPVEVINEAIYRLGIVHSLPAEHRVVLVSTQDRGAIAPTFAEWAPSVEAAVGAAPITVLPQAGDCLPCPQAAAM